jgi:methylglutaconyl-CoA hydratase
MVEVEQRGTTRVLRLNRPEVGNALNGEVIAALGAALAAVQADPGVRTVVLTAAGKVFSAGADLKWMLRMNDATAEENIRDAEQTAALFATLYDFPRPVIAAVNGPARGGGVGLVAACDFAVAVSSAHFAFTEVRVGVIPAMISPFVLRKLGESRARRLFLTGETFSAAQAFEWGLLDRVVEFDQLDAAVEDLARTLRQCGPHAIAAVKQLIRRVSAAPAAEVADLTARLIADVRATDEAREGMRAFLEKRPPRWVVD